MVLFFTLLSITIVAVTMSTINAEICRDRTCNSGDITWCCPFYLLCGDLVECLDIKTAFGNLPTETTTSLLPRCPDKKECYSYSSYWCCPSGQTCGTTIRTCQKINTYRYIICIICIILVILKWCLSPKRRKANATTAIIPPAQNEGVETHAYSMTNISYPNVTANPLDQSCIVLIPNTTIPAATTEDDPPTYDAVTIKQEDPPTYDAVTSTARREQSEA